MPKTAKTVHDDGTLAAAVAIQNETQEVAQERIAGLMAHIDSLMPWFTDAVPSHVNAEQYVAVAKAELQLNPKLANAACTNPDSLMMQLARCARLGLIIGDTFYLTHFWNTKGRRFDIVGMVSYKGEVDLMFRSGGVADVHAQEVRARDDFDWQPTMTLPHHVIADHGLADDEERGALRAVYSWARLTTGGTECAVLNKGAVMRRRAKAKTLDFWGPAWPQEGENTVQMWWKSGVHALRWQVPQSAEFIRERLRASAWAARQALEAGDLEPPKDPAAIIPLAGPKALNGPEAPAGPDDTQPPEGVSGTAQAARVHAEGCVRRDNHAAPEQCEVATVVGHGPHALEDEFGRAWPARPRG